MGLLIVTAAWTGTRWGEIAGLQRDNTHLDDGVIVIDRHAGGLHESGTRMWLGPPKTEALVRVITLPPFLIDLLREHLQRTAGIPVFTGPKGPGCGAATSTAASCVRPPTAPSPCPAPPCACHRSYPG
jgi:integrase